MAVIRWEPARELQTIQQEMNRVFGTLFDAPTASAGSQPARQWIPAMDLVEKDGEYVLHADLPGVSEKDVKIEFEQNVLTLSGERHSEHEVKKGGYYRRERASGTFARSLTLPEGIDGNSIKASFANGVLEVHIPKPEERKPQRVAINVAGAEQQPAEPEVVEGQPAAVAAA